MHQPTHTKDFSSSKIEHVHYLKLSTATDLDPVIGTNPLITQLTNKDNLIKHKRVFSVHGREGVK